MTVLHIVVAMKPVEGNYAENAISNKVAGLNIDGGRVESVILDSERRTSNSGTSEHINFGTTKDRPPKFDGQRHNPAGRWPANVIHDGSDEVKAEFPETKSGSLTGNEYKDGHKGKNVYGVYNGFTTSGHKGDSGSAARFFKECKV